MDSLLCLRRFPAPGEEMPPGFVRYRGFIAPEDAVKVVWIWRGVGKECAGKPHLVPMEPRPVSQEEIDWLCSLFSVQHREFTIRLDEAVRVMRGDVLSEPHILDSPWSMTEGQAIAAASARMNTEHLWAGVRKDNGRWVWWRGLSGHRVAEGAADTKEEAVVMARASLYTAWCARLREIMAMRGGVLDWGSEIHSPNEIVVEE